MPAADRYLEKPWLKFYPKGVPATVEVPRKSVSQVFDEATDRWADRAAVAFYGREVPYREVREGPDRLAVAFGELGVRKGDRVALYLLNSPQFIIAYFAALKCGATVTPISPMYTSHEVRYQLEDSGARAVVCQDILHDKVVKSGAPLDLIVVTSVAEYLPSLKRLLGRGPLARFFSDLEQGTPEIAPAPNQHWLQELLRKYPARPPAVAIDPDTDLAALPYTGGTTGNPKGVMLTHRNLVAARQARRPGRRHAARVDHAGLGAPHRFADHRGIRPLGDLRDEPLESRRPHQAGVVRLPGAQCARRRRGPRDAGVRHAGADRRAGALGTQRDEGLLAPARGDGSGIRRARRRALDADRRHRPHGRRGLFPLLRPGQGPHQVQGPFRLREGRRGRAVWSPAREGGGRDRGARSGGRPADQGRGGAADRRARPRQRAGDPGGLPRAARRLQGPPRGRVPRRSSQDRPGQGLAPRAA